MLGDSVLDIIVKNINSQVGSLVSWTRLKISQPLSKFASVVDMSTSQILMYGRILQDFMT